MLQHHARPGPAHDRADLVAARCLVTMYGTRGAGRLGFAKLAMCQPRMGVGQQVGAVIAQGVIGVVMGMTPHLDHGGDGILFALDSGAEVGHGWQSTPRTTSRP